MKNQSEADFGLVFSYIDYILLEHCHDSCNEGKNRVELRKSGVDEGVGLYVVAL